MTTAAVDADVSGRSTSSPRYTRAATAALVLLLGIPFLLCVDGDYRGLEDNNQYIVEALQWARGDRPPVPALVLDRSEERWGPEYVSPLTPYVWSWIVDPQDPIGGIGRLQLFQAVLMIAVIAIAFRLLSRRAGGAAAAATTTLLFANESFRSFVSIPHTEPLAVLLLLVAYAAPRWALAATVLQMMTRPPVAVLMIPSVIRTIRDARSIALGAVAAALGYLRFSSLLVPTPGRGAELSLRRTVENLLSAGQDTVKNLIPFEPLLPIADPPVIAAAILVAATLLFAMSSLRQNPILFGTTALYLLACATQFGQGLRYLLPVMVLLALEQRAFLNASLRVPRPVALLAVWLGVIHLTSFGFDSDTTNATAPPRELLALRTDPPPKLQEAQVLMMNPYRLCVVAFNRPCVAVPLRRNQTVDKVLRYEVDLVLLPAQGNRAADAFVELLAEELDRLGLNVAQFTSVHERARLIDAKAIRESLPEERR